MGNRGAYGKRNRDRWQPSDRQRAVLDLLAEGKGNAEIAAALGITLDGAKWHVGELLAQTGVDDRQALAAWWRREQGKGRGWVVVPGLRFGWLSRGSVAAVVVVSLVLVAAALTRDNQDRVLAPAAIATTPGSPSPTPLREEPAFTPVPLAYQPAGVPDSCPVSQMWRLRPEQVVTSMPNAGTGDGRTAWLSWAPVTGWFGPSYPSLVLWTIASDVGEPAVISGRRLDGGGIARFASQDSPDDLSDSLLLSAPHGAPHRVYTFIPDPGCWQFQLQTGQHQVQITIYVDGQPIPDSCPVSPGREVRPDIAPGIGGDDIWMISGQSRSWAGADVPIKTIWIIDESVTGAVRLTGERIDGPGDATFGSNEDIPEYEHVQPSDDEPTVASINARNMERLLLVRQPERTIEPPHRLRNDHRGYVFYPSPGCWRFNAETDQGTFEIIQYVSPLQP